MLNAKFWEMVNVCSGFVPVDMQAAANNGDWVNLANYAKLVIVLFKAAGTAGDDPTLTIKQATDASGTGAKALNFTKAAIKQGTLTAVADYTAISQAAGNTYTNDTLAESQAILIVDIDNKDLDVANGFKFVQASVADVGGNAQLGCCLYFLIDARYAGASLPSGIA